MQIIRDLETLRATIAGWRASGERIALVPTLGALHAGHMALVEEAARSADRIVTSIFVNPTQFGPNEDYTRYPRQEADDAAMLEKHGCDLIWAPDVATMYPDGFATTISVKGISEGLCGAVRPGHFDGVATVVAKLLGQVRPDIALFGEKDFQQLAVIRRMTIDLDLGIEIKGVPIVREVDGLALSSRNVYLSAAERSAATALPHALGQAATNIAKGIDPGEAIEAARLTLASAGFDPIDYIELRDSATLAPVTESSGEKRLLAAAWLGRTRLIDNLAVSPSTNV